MAYDAMGRYIPDQMGMAGPQGQLTNQGGFFNTQLPQQPTGAMPAAQTGPVTGAQVGSSPSLGTVAGGLALGGLLSNNFNLGDFASSLGNYYVGQQGLEGAQQMGQSALTTAGALGQQAMQASQFKPYTVTTGLGRAATTPQGGYTLELSPQQQALQAQLMGQAQNLFGQVGQDPAAQQAALYEQIRAAQLPEEERQRLAMQENLFASGRGGLQTAQYGGSPEQFAYEKARQEAMAGASLGARQQAMAEQQQALAGATGLLGAGYQPQQQALSLLEASQIPAGYTAAGQRTGAELGAQMSGRGIEGYIQGQDLGNRLQLQQQQGLMNLLLGQQTSPLDQAKIAQIYAAIGKDNPSASGGLLGSILNSWLGSQTQGQGDYGDIGDPFADNFGGGQ